MQRHVSNNQDAVIESPLHLLLLIKLLIAFCPFFSLQTAGLRKKTLSENEPEKRPANICGGGSGDSGNKVSS